MSSGDKRKTKKRGGVEQELKEKQQEYDELKDHAVRLQADFENYQKHMSRQQEKFIKTANQYLMKDLLEVLDGLELAIKSMKEVDSEKAEGLEMLYSNLMKTLEKHGLKRIEALDKKFDPYYHEIILQEESDKEEGTVIEELQKGYLLNNNVLRHTKVKVAKGGV